MIYTDLTKKAIRIAFEVHKEQTDKSGLPYVFHPFHLAEQMEDEVSACVALLHDVVEDSELTFDDLSKEGFSDDVIQSLKLLTHSSNVPYMEYISLIKQDSIAKKVKLADLKHNSDLTRLNVIDDEVLERVRKYQLAIRILEE